MHEPREHFSFAHLHTLARELNACTRSPAEVCARFVLLHLHARHPGQWLSSPRVRSRGQAGVLCELEKLTIALSPRQSARLADVEDVPALFGAYYVRGVVLDAHEGLVGWLEKRYPLHLRLDIPTPDEMLAAQCEGVRFVTLLLDDEQQFVAHGRHRDACAFLLHDFEHAHKFFGDSRLLKSQRAFFRNLRASLEHFASWSADPAFAKDLEYLKSDMNSHPVHLMKYLKAVVLSAEMRRTGERHPALEEFWRRLFASWHMPAAILKAALRLNQPESETDQDLVQVADFFSQ